MRSFILAAVLAYASAAVVPAGQRLAARDGIIPANTFSNSQVVTSPYTTCPTIAGEGFTGIQIFPGSPTSTNGSYLLCHYNDGICGYTKGGDLTFHSGTSFNNIYNDICEKTPHSFVRPHFYGISSCYTVCPTPKNYTLTDESISSFGQQTNPFLQAPIDPSFTKLLCSYNHNGNSFTASWNITTGAQIDGQGDISARAGLASNPLACIDVKTSS